MKAWKKYVPAIFLMLLLVAVLPAAGQFRKGVDSLLPVLPPSGELRQLPTTITRPLIDGVSKTVSDEKGKVKSYLQGLQQLKPAPVKKGFVQQGLSIDLQGTFSQSYLQPPAYNILSNLYVQERFSVNNMPVIAAFGNNMMWADRYYQLPNWSVNYDRDAYLKQLKARVQQAVKPEQVLPDDKIVADAKLKLNALLTQQSQALETQYAAVISANEAKISDVQSLLQQPQDQIKQRLYDQVFLSKIRQEQDLLNTLQRQRAEGVAIDTSLLTRLKTSLGASQDMDKFYAGVSKAKQKIDHSGLQQAINKANELRNVKFRQMLNDPQSLKQFAMRFLPISGLEKIMMDVNKLKTGTNATNISPLTLSDFRGTGISTEITKGNKYLFLIYNNGKQGGVTDMPFTSVVTPASNYAVTGISAGWGASLEKNYVHVSIFNFSQRNNNGVNAYSPALPKGTVVITMSNGLKIGEDTRITAEISRSGSAGQHQTTMDDTTVASHPVLGSALSGKGNNSVAIDLGVEGNYDAIGLNGAFTLLWVSRDYFNPGSPYVMNGSRQVDLQLKKYFLERKLVVNTRFDYRRYSFDPTGNDSWTNTYFYLDTKWNLKNGQFVSLSYIPSTGVRTDDHTSMPTAASRKLTATGNVNHRFGTMFYQNTFSVGNNDNQYNLGAVGNDARTQSLLFSSMQYLSLGDNAVVLNAQYDHVYQRTNDSLYNSSINMDASYAFPVKEHLDMTTGIGYYAVKDWYRQAGIKYGFSWQLNKHLYSNIYLDVRTNIGTPKHYFGYNDLLRGDWSIKYTF